METMKLRPKPRRKTEFSGLSSSDCEAIRIREVKEPQVPSGVWGRAPSSFSFYENIFSSSSYFSCVINASCVVPTRCTTYVQRP